MSVPHGYSAYWPFHRDKRSVIDITLGVVLSESGECDILGYVALPRWMTDTRTFRFSGSSSRIDLFGRTDLDFLEQILDVSHG